MKYAVCLFVLCWSFPPVAATADHPLLPGYLDYPEFTERLQTLAEHEHVQLHSLGSTVGNRQIHQLTIAQGDAESQPAILIVGGMDANRPVSSELAVRLAEKITTQWDSLDRLTVYVIPRANPDGVERAFQQPYRASSGNGRLTDDDRDGELAEDPPEDLDGDGMITSLRVYRTGGAFRADPDDPRIDVPAEPEQGKPGEFDVLVEGIDNDADESWNEDPGDGVAFNRNFTFQYQPFQVQTGPHAVSEMETRAVADFAWDHPNIAVILCLGAEDNLTNAWRANPQERSRVRTSVVREDADYFAYVAKQFQEIVKLEAADSPSLNGSLLAWGYFHYGRWSFGSGCWRIPDEPASDAAGAERTAKAPGNSAASPDERPTDSTADEETQVADESPANRPPQRPSPRGRRPGQRRGRPGMERPGEPPSLSRRESAKTPSETARDRKALKWMESQQLDGFTPWTTMVHPDFPGLRVDVGGIRPWWRENPPVDQIDGLADKHLAFLTKISTEMPHLEIESLTHESVGHGIFRVTARIANTGYLSTSTHFEPRAD